MKIVTLDVSVINITRGFRLELWTERDRHSQLNKMDPTVFAELESELRSVLSAALTKAIALVDAPRV